MSVIIEVTSAQVQTRSGTSNRTGKAYSMNEQTAYLHRGESYPEKIKITLDNGQPPYQPGNYSLHPTSFYADRFNALTVRPVLVPLPAQSQQSPARGDASLPEGVKASK